MNSPALRQKLLRACWLAVPSLPALCLCTGCIIVPVNYHTWQSRKNVRAEDPQWLVAGQTTRHEALLRLGEPDDVTEDDSQMTYAWEKVHLLVLVGSNGYTGGGATFGRDYSLELTFDGQGKLLRTAQNKSKTKATYF